MNENDIAIVKRRVWALTALALVVVAMWLQSPAEDLVYLPLRRALHLPHALAPNVLMCASFNLDATLRLIWWSLITGIVLLLDGRGLWTYLRCNTHQLQLFAKGLVSGLGLMIAVILTITAIGDGRISSASGMWTKHLQFGLEWMWGEIVGAAGEELEFRFLIFVLVARLAGRWPAIFLSAAAFAYVHGANPGASKIWMVRLAAAGLLLAFAVWRSRGIWWGIGYHAGWNFGSAPLFGAAGSGYMNEGHLLSFAPKGSDLITGGLVGPEGSMLAFVAVLFATGLFLLMVRPSLTCRTLPT